ncbi:MAG TPA: hypothetical protein VE891_01715 [Allosphingosinicella sp.]|nr:hypothetical protein [Allosphingosinicella sp.]
MKKFALALAAFVFAAPVASTAQGVAPAAKRKPVASSAAPAAPQQTVRSASERDVQAALASASGQSGDAALDTSLIRVMSRLVVAGRCGEAASLAARDGRRELAARAQQLCK